MKLTSPLSLPQALMAPRSARTLVEEISVWKPPPGTPPPASDPATRRTLSDVASRSTSVLQGVKNSTPPLTSTSKPTKRLSDFVHRADKPPAVGSKNGELVQFLLPSSVRTNLVVLLFTPTRSVARCLLRRYDPLPTHWGHRHPRWLLARQGEARETRTNETKRPSP